MQEPASGKAPAVASAPVENSRDNRRRLQARSQYYPQEFATAEEELVVKRREQAQCPPDSPLVGVACSGGGIRSATFCLGIFQALAQQGRLQRVDFLSTISGGGYFGGFLGSLFRNRDSPAATDTDLATPKSCERVYAALASAQSEPIRWLRQYGRYIAPDGPADYGTMAAVYLRNWFGVHFVIASAFLTVFLLLIVLHAPLSLLSDWLLPAGWGRFQPDAFVLSPWITVAIAMFALFCVPLSIAFWLTQYGVSRNGVLIEQGDFAPNRVLLRAQKSNYALYTLSLVTVTSAFIACGPVSIRAILALCISVVCVLGFSTWLFAEIRSANDEARPGNGFAAWTLGAHQSRVRNKLSGYLGHILVAAICVLCLALIDSMAETIYARAIPWGPKGALALSVSGAVLMPLVHRFAPLLANSFKSSRISWWKMAVAAGWALLFIVLVGWDLLAYAIAFQGAARPGASLAREVGIVAVIALVIGIVLNVLTGFTMAFVNLSSLQAFYGARLRRAYLGAANPARTDAPSASSETSSAHAAAGKSQSVRHDANGDDVPWSAYKPHVTGGPLHLLGVTVNHTVVGGSNLELRDRKGFTMSVGPVGMSAEIASHATWARSTATDTNDALIPVKSTSLLLNHFGNAQHQAESMPLSRWIAISGAAFSTGLGARTSTGISLLMGLANVRLGYWWESDTSNHELVRRPFDWFSAQRYLFQELLGRFPGATQLSWYLSDGGHSENTGAYELVRRHLPIIVLIDCGADSEYRFEDFANLIRRIRIDFNAEIVAHDENSLRPSEPIADVIGGLLDLRRSLKGPMGVRLAKKAVALFDVRYNDTNECSQIVLIKPTLVGDEPEDVTYYANAHAAFPHESTLDQFFDEAQWESYRRLGAHIGAKLFRHYDFSRL